MLLTDTMFELRAATALSLTCAIVSRVLAQDVDYSQFVNPFIGSEGGIVGYACKLPWSLTISNQRDV